MIKAIVFDIGGVLIGLDLGRCINAFREDLGFDQITALLDPCHRTLATRRAFTEIWKKAR